MAITKAETVFYSPASSDDDMSILLASRNAADMTIDVGGSSSCEVRIRFESLTTIKTVLVLRPDQAKLLYERLGQYLFDAAVMSSGGHHESNN